MKELKLRTFRYENELLNFVNTNQITIQQICPIVYQSWIEYYQLFYYELKREN